MRRMLVLALVIAATSFAPPSAAVAGPTELPAVRRRVPDHPDSILDGCSPSERQSIFDRIVAAIEVGAPTYNDGDYLGCYRVYESAARGLEATLSPACSGPARALREGRARAEALRADSDKAWAMRDTFDGLLLVLERTGTR